MKLIDKDALVAEIERRRNICKKVILDLRSQENKDYYQGKAESYKDVLSSIDTLEVKEVDLEKHLKEDIDDEWCDEWSGDVGNWIRCRRGTTSMEVEDVKDIAKHFFELGLKAQKGKNNG